MLIARKLTIREEPLDVFVGEPNGGVTIRKLVLACAIAKDDGASAISKDLLYLAIRMVDLLQPHSL